MYEDQEDVYFYLTLMNENYSHPDMPMGVEEDIIRYPSTSIRLIRVQETNLSPISPPNRSTIETGH